VDLIVDLVFDLILALWSFLHPLHLFFILFILVIVFGFILVIVVIVVIVVFTILHCGSGGVSDAGPCVVSVVFAPCCVAPRAWMVVVIVVLVVIQIDSPTNQL
jgi:hypothetical protein